MFLSRGIDFSSKLDFSDMCAASDDFSKFNMPGKEHFFWTETFRVFEGLLYLSKDKILSQNYAFLIFWYLPKNGSTIQ
jgi:hypothetical protein